MGFAVAMCALLWLYSGCAALVWLYRLCSGRAGSGVAVLLCCGCVSFAVAVQVV